MYDHVSLRVNHLRFGSRVSQKQIALKAGLSAPTLSNKVNGVTRWTLDEVVAIADTFGVTLDYLIGRQPIESATPRKRRNPLRRGGFVVTLCS
ncbi:helix-turn-helix transcriptional regulator [Leucobacter sp. 7(1)]|uniref:helix-turn-helix domain-containing protein n=1 Tax=Leucobacter sp. 7(1) TaxID=1255613 RepID=UPI000B34E1E2